MGIYKSIYINLLSGILIILMTIIIVSIFIGKEISLVPSNERDGLSLEEHYSSNSKSYIYNEKVIKKSRGDKEVLGRGDLNFIKRTDSNGGVYYLTNSGGFLEIVSSIIYNPLNADISQECTMKEVRTCKCYQKIGWCVVEGHY